MVTIPWAQPHPPVLLHLYVVSQGYLDKSGENFAMWVYTITLESPILSLISNFCIGHILLFWSGEKTHWNQIWYNLGTESRWEDEWTFPHVCCRGSLHVWELSAWPNPLKLKLLKLSKTKLFGVPRNKWIPCIRRPWWYCTRTLAEASFSSNLLPEK